ncbi:MAG: hypothetical protein KBT03_09680 [Bacteroidales bacterium]|nr:hypothetical protein [Candidatus Scybalousia scybalohippi]
MSILRLKNGKSLNKACIENGVCYETAWRQIENGYDADYALEYAIKHHGDKTYNRKHFYKGHYVGDLLGGWKSVLHLRFLAEYRRTKDLEKTLSKYIDITKVEEI